MREAAVDPSVQVSVIEINPTWYKQGPAWRSWFMEAWVAWLFFGATILVCVLADWAGCLAEISRVDRLPYGGWLLEIAGVATAVLGFAKRIDLYGGDSIPSRIKRWLRVCPLFKQHRSLIAGSGNLQLSGARANITAHHNLPVDADLDARVSRLERMVDGLTDGLQNLREKTEADIETLKKELDEQLDAVNQEIAAVKEQTSEAHIGGVGMELAGIGWILVGLTFATVPEFILWLFGPVISLLEIQAINCRP